MTIHFGDGTSISTEVAPSKVAQVVNATKTGAWVYRYYTGWVDVGLTLNINPTASSSKIILVMTIYCSARDNDSTDSLNNIVEAQIGVNGNYNLFIGTQADNTTDIIPSDPTNLSFLGSNTFSRVTGATGCRSDRISCIAQNFEHSPNSTQQQQYKVRIRRPNGQGYQSWLFQGRNFSGGSQAPSSLTAFEIRA